MTDLHGVSQAQLDSYNATVEAHSGAVGLPSGQHEQDLQQSCKKAACLLARMTSAFKNFLTGVGKAQLELWPQHVYQPGPRTSIGSAAAATAPASEFCSPFMERLNGSAVVLASKPVTYTSAASHDHAGC